MEKDNNKPENSTTEINAEENKNDVDSKPRNGLENESAKDALQDKESETTAETKEGEEDNHEKHGHVGENREEIQEGDAREEAPPQIHYTLESLSEEFDQFLASVSSHKNVSSDDKKNDDVHDDNADYFQIPQFVGKFLDLVEEEVAKNDLGETKRKWCQDQEEDSKFLEAIDRVSRLLDLLMEIQSCLDHHETLINHAGAIQQRAMAFLEDEFRILLEESWAKDPDPVIQGDDHHHKKGDHEQNNETPKQDEENPDFEDETIDFPGYPDEVVSLFKKVSDIMIKGGYGSECREVYLIARRNALLHSLKDQEFEKVSIDDVQKMNWEALEREIPIWNKTLKDCSALYFPNELKLAEQVFPGDHRALFNIIAHNIVLGFLSFAEAVSMTKRSTEKLFKLLDMYETLRDNFPAMESLFPEEHWNELKAEVTHARCRLGETVILIFLDLENSIKTDSSKTPVPGGAVHPLTRYILNYLKYTCEYKDTLEQVFKVHAKIERNDSTSRPHYDREHPPNNSSSSNNNNNNDENTSPFSCQLMRIMALLDASLESKSKLYRDIPLSCIFMMNNGRYIVQKIKGSPEIHQVMGDTWCRRRSSDLRNYHKNYQRETWGKLLGCLGHEGLMHNGKIVKPNLKERFKSFNAMFDDIHKTQTTWVVNDEQLQSELRVSISAVIIPAYRSFLGRFSQFLDPGRQSEKYIKYQPEDIEDLIDELFDGRKV